METGFITLIILMVLFVLLGMYDGIYLHIFKYRLYENPDSKFEHLTHTVRAVLFPFILFFLYMQETASGFYIGISFVALDLVTLGVDAYEEKDSRSFMGGLPRWEYIIHLFVNGFHFAAIAVFLVLKIDMSEGGIVLRNNFQLINSYSAFQWLIENLIPGAILTSLLHIIVASNWSVGIYNKVRNKIICC